MRWVCSSEFPVVSRPTAVAERHTAILASNPRDAEAWAELGLTYRLEVKHAAWGGGRRELDQSLSALEHSLLANGHAEKAVPLIEQALDAVVAPPDRNREIAGFIYLMVGQPAQAVEEFGRLHGAGMFSGMRNYTGWLLAASLAHAGRINEASAVIRQAQTSRPERTLESVAVSLDELAEQNVLDVVLEGLGLAGMAN